jgi:hypothetical protein
MNSNPTFQVAKKLLNQIDNESSQCSFWLFSAINRMLDVNENMSLDSFLDELKKINPKTYKDFKEYAERKNFRIV